MHVHTYTRERERVCACARERARARERWGGLFLGVGQGFLRVCLVGERRGSAGASDRPRSLPLCVPRSFLRFVGLARARGLVAERGGS